MSRIGLSLLALVGLAAIPLFAETPATLADVHTVYLNVGDLSARRDIKAAFKRELPQVKVVSTMRGADAVIQLRGTGPSENPVATTQVSVSNVTSYDSRTGVTNYDTKTVTVPIGQPTHNPGHMQALLVRGGRETVLLDGLWTPAFPTQTAVQFIRAWRDANR